MMTDDSDHPQTTNLNLDHQSSSNVGCEVEPDPLMTSSPKTKLPKGSAQLNRWSRARTLRSGRRFELPVQKKDEQNRTSSSPLSPQRTGVTTVSEEEEEEMGTADEEEKVEQISKEVGGKVIYMVSDGTGWTLEHAVNAALGQFEYFLLHRKCAVSTRLFSGIETVDGLLDVIKQAAKEGALLLYTLVDPTMAEPAKHACRLWGVPSVDILRPTTEAIASHLGVEPSGIPRSERKMPLTEEYFRRIEAIEFTIKQDDGALPQNLNQADILLVGVSRSGKTPLSIYLAQKGYKVANVPLVSGIKLPNTLFEVDQEKVFALSINPVILQNIRKARAKTLGLNRDMQCTYTEMDHVRKEVEFATRIYARNPLWPVIGIKLPNTLFEVDQEKVFALSINPVILQNIRKARAKTLGLNRDMQCTYTEMDHVRKEVEFATRIYARNPLWPVIDVTGKAIEETAAVILRIYHDRKQKFSMPSISRQY